MPQSPQAVYARHLVSDRGYPLWTPEPDLNLPEEYLRGGFRIGDVGVVVPQDGSFDVFFNICLPKEHLLHQGKGVPDNFTHVMLDGRDIAKYPDAENAGRVISSSSMARVNSPNVLQEVSERHIQPGPLNYEFTLSPKDGAALILPEGAERYYLRNERPFLDQAIQHAVEWYTFAERDLGRIVSHDSLYLITGFYKACSWSLAAYQQPAGRGDALAQFKAVQVGEGNIGACYTWETTQAMDWRVGPSDRYYNGVPNQTVFIQGLKIAIREGILGSKWVDVKADNPTVHPYRVEFSSGSWFSSLWGGLSGNGSAPASAANTSRRADKNVDTTENDAMEDIIIHRIPQIAKLFHPSDAINKFLLQEAPSASVAVTHDSHWISLLQNGLLKPAETSQNDRLLTEVKQNYSIVREGDVVYLQSTMAKFAGVDGEQVYSRFSDDARSPVTSTSGFDDRSPRGLAALPIHAPLHSPPPCRRNSWPSCAQVEYSSMQLPPRMTRSSASEPPESTPASDESHQDSDVEDVVQMSPMMNQFQIQASWEVSQSPHHILRAQALQPSVMTFQLSDAMLQPVDDPGNRRMLRGLLDMNTIGDEESGVTHRSSSMTSLSSPSILPTTAQLQGPGIRLRQESKEVAQSSQFRGPVQVVQPSNSDPLLLPHSLINSGPRDQTPSDVRQQKKSKMHQCEQCKKMFPRPSGLATHMNTHSGAKPYKCIVPNCEKRFAVRSNAKRHLRTHGINPSSPDLLSLPHYTVGFEESMANQVQDAGGHRRRYIWMPHPKSDSEPGTTSRTLQGSLTSGVDGLGPGLRF